MSLQIINKDVCSDEEPIFELDQQEWIGTKVERIQFPESKAAKCLCKSPFEYSPNL